MMLSTKVRGSQFSEALWEEFTANQLAMQFTLRPRGRQWPKIHIKTPDPFICAMCDFAEFRSR